MLYTTLIVFHVILAAALIAIVLVQRGPGATMGAAFGAGASGTVFGSRGSASFLTRTTTWMGIGFFAISLSMAVILARSVGASAPVDDLGVAAGLEQSAGAEAADSSSSDDEFLSLPIEGDDASTGSGSMSSDTASDASATGTDTDQGNNSDAAEAGETAAEPADPPMS
jgi:preprotein translocase subunit SecG